MLAGMERRTQFGLRPQREPSREARAVAVPAPPVPEPAEALASAAAGLDLYSGDAEVDRELADWKAMRKLKKRSFREPWRSFSIAAGIAFGVGPFILPPDVADIANYVTLGLFAASVIAGLIRPRT